MGLKNKLTELKNALSYQFSRRENISVELERVKVSETVFPKEIISPEKNIVLENEIGKLYDDNKSVEVITPSIPFEEMLSELDHLVETPEVKNDDALCNLDAEFITGREEKTPDTMDANTLSDIEKEFIKEHSEEIRVETPNLEKILRKAFNIDNK